VGSDMCIRDRLRGAVSDGDVNDSGPVGHPGIPAEPGPSDARQGLGVDPQRPRGLDDEGLADRCVDDTAGRGHVAGQSQRGKRGPEQAADASAGMRAHVHRAPKGRRTRSYATLVSSRVSSARSRAISRTRFSWDEHIRPARRVAGRRVHGWLARRAGTYRNGPNRGDDRPAPLPVSSHVHVGRESRIRRKGSPGQHSPTHCNSIGE
jgi:hypothetical protein